MRYVFPKDLTRYLNTNSRVAKEHILWDPIPSVAEVHYSKSHSPSVSFYFHKLKILTALTT